MNSRTNTASFFPVIVHAEAGIFDKLLNSAGQIKVFNVKFEKKNCWVLEPSLNFVSQTVLSLSIGKELFAASSGAAQQSKPLVLPGNMQALHGWL